MVANPTDLVKVRLQSEGQLPSGVPMRYSGAMDAYITIVRQVGHFYVYYVLFLYAFENISTSKCMIHTFFICKIGRIRSFMDWAWA